MQIVNHFRTGKCYVYEYSYFTYRVLDIYLKQLLLKFKENVFEMFIYCYSMHVCVSMLYMLSIGYVHQTTISINEIFI